MAEGARLDLGLDAEGAAVGEPAQPFGHRGRGQPDPSAELGDPEPGVAVQFRDDAPTQAQGLPPQSFFLVSAVFHYLGPACAVLLATVGVRTPPNAGALALTVCGVAALADVRLAGRPLGFAFAFANCALFVLYVVVGHRVANTDAGTGAMSGIDQLGAATLVAAVVVTPMGLGGALAALTHPVLLLAGVGVGLCSSVIPYVTDQLAMARLPRATFSLMLALLPTLGTIIGAIVLRQLPTGQDLLGIALVAAGVALHQVPADEGPHRHATA
jgi:threonine/homoserine efflux transporter RhtA